MKPLRLDKNVIYNVRSFDTLSRPGDRLLIKRLVGLVSYAFQSPVLEEDIFGNKILTPDRVAQVFSYNKIYLKNAHPEPCQFENLPPEDLQVIKERDVLAGQLKKEGEPSWFTNLDNALYQIFYKEIPYVELGKTVEGDSFSALKGLRVFQSIRKIYLNKTRKTIYEYREDPGFIRNTASYFLSIDFDLFRKLNETELDIYLMLIRSRSAEQYRFRTMYLGVEPTEVRSTGYTIDYLAKVWGLDYQFKEEERFSRTKHKINQVIESINEKAGYPFVQILWEKARATDRFDGHPVLVFPHNKAEAEAYQQNINQRAGKYYLYFLKERFRQVKTKEVMSPEDFRKQFAAYLWNEETDVGGKIDVMEEVHKLIFRKQMGEQHRSRLVKELKTFINEVLHEEPKEEFMEVKG